MSKNEQNIIQCRNRVAAVFLHEEHLLLQGEPQGTFWILPGGAIEPLESSQEALRREMGEELDIDIQVERLLWITEEFFIADDFPNHQLGFYYFQKSLRSFPSMIYEMIATGSLSHEREASAGMFPLYKSEAYSQ